MRLFNLSTDAMLTMSFVADNRAYTRYALETHYPADNRPTLKQIPEVDLEQVRFGVEIGLIALDRTTLHSVCGWETPKAYKVLEYLVFECKVYFTQELWLISITKAATVRKSFARMFLEHNKSSIII